MTDDKLQFAMHFIDATTDYMGAVCSYVDSIDRLFLTIRRNFRIVYRVPPHSDRTRP